MASAASHVSFLPPVLTFCAAAVVAVPLFRLLGLSAVIGYLAAGIAIGPFALSLIADPQTTATVAELGVVLLLFIVGLELKLSQLWEMRRDIFGLGLAQLILTSLALGTVAYFIGSNLNAAIVTGVALALSATSIALQILEESGDLQTSYGRRAFAILLFQDLSIVPFLALLPLLAVSGANPDGSFIETAKAIGLAGIAIAAVILIGRYGLNILFRILARTGAREVMTAFALLVVLGAALLMQEVGLSMAMGAFLAGLLLAESNFRHQLEADIEPFRGILLGLFFMSVGMSIDLDIVRQNWILLLLAVPFVLAFKTGLVCTLFLLTGGSWRDGFRAGAIVSPAGEFAFVLLPLAVSLGIMTSTIGQLVIALSALTMLLGPLLAKAVDFAVNRSSQVQASEEDIAEGGTSDTSSRVLVVGFGRFGQVVNQVLLSQGIEVSVIDNDVNRIRDASRFGLRIYYGDGTRLDVLRAAGADKAEILCICVDDPAASLKIVDIAHEEFRFVRTFVRARDRLHALDLMKSDVDFQLRETFESAIAFGKAALEELGLEPDQAAEAADEVRKRDIARLILQKAAGPMGGADLIIGATVSPEPLIQPTAKSRPLSAETKDLLEDDALK